MLPGIMLCMLFTNGDFTAVFRGLYPEAAAISFFLLYLGWALRTWSLPPERRSIRIPVLFILSFLMLKSLTPLIVFLPAVIAADEMRKEIASLRSRLEKAEKLLQDKKEQKPKKTEGLTAVLRQATWLVAIGAGAWIIVTIINALT